MAALVLAVMRRLLPGSVAGPLWNSRTTTAWLVAVIARYDGTVNKFIGNAVMACSGAVCS